MWLYVPNLSTSSPSAPEAAGSISESNWRFPALAQSVWWRGKPSPSRTWWQRWNKVSWLRLLCGAMPEPSTADAGVDAWTASLAASRVSPTALPGGSVEASMSATCGPTPDASSCNPDAGSSLSKMSAACSRRGLTKSLEPSGYGETFASLVSRLRSDCSRRRKSARAMSGSGSSSSAWPTPAVPNGGRSNAEGVLSATGMTAEGEKRQVDLNYAAKMFHASAWPTPSARDWKGSNQEEMHDRGAKGAPLNETAVLWAPPKWPTPAVTDSFGARNRTSGRSDPESKHHDGVTLSDAITMWSTPRSSDGEKGGPNQAFGAGGVPLPAQASQMALAQDIYSPLARVTVKTGKSHSKERRSLNPLFVEWLMGWPPGWTLLVSTDFACSATGSYPSRPPSPSERSLNASPAKDMIGYGNSASNEDMPALRDDVHAPQDQAGTDADVLGGVQERPPQNPLAGTAREDLLRWQQRMRSALSAIALPAEAPPAQLALFG